MSNYHVFHFIARSISARNRTSGDIMGTESELWCESVNSAVSGSSEGSPPTFAFYAPPAPPSFYGG